MELSAGGVEDLAVRVGDENAAAIALEPVEAGQSEKVWHAGEDFEVLGALAEGGEVVEGEGGGAVDIVADKHIGEAAVGEVFGADEAEGGVVGVGFF